MRSFLTEIEAG